MQCPSKEGIKRTENKYEDLLYRVVNMSGQ